MTARQKAFVREYLVDMNGAQAAIRAGYAKKNARITAAQLLTNPNVGESLRKAIEKRAQRTEAKADDVIEELRKVAFSRITDFTSFGPQGIVIKDSRQLSEDAAACVQMVSETVTKDGGTVKFQLHNKVDALKTLLQHLTGAPIGGEIQGLTVILQRAERPQKESVDPDL